MTTTTTPSRVEGHDVGAVAVKAPTLAWAIRRTLLAIVILLVSIAGAAFLLYASIDPGEEGWPGAAEPRSAWTSPETPGPRAHPLGGSLSSRVQWSRGRSAGSAQSLTLLSIPEDALAAPRAEFTTG